jgi:MFS family permease
MAQRILNVYLFSTFFINLAHSFFFATYSLFLVSRGLDLLEVNSVNIFFMLFAVFSEIPTGAFADSFGRKKSILIGCFLYSISFYVYFLSFDFWLFVAAELIGALGNSFINGAFEAWAVDALKFNNFNGTWKNVFRKEGTVRVIGFGLGGLIGAYMGNMDISYPWLAGSISFLVLTFSFGIILKEEYFEKDDAPKEKQAFTERLVLMFQTAKNGFLYSWKRKAIFYITLFGLIYTLVIQAINMQWQILLKESFEMSVLNLGWFYFLMSIFMLIGNEMVEKISSSGLKEEIPIILSQIFTAAGIFIAAFIPDLNAVMGGMMIHQIGRGALSPLKKTYINHRVDDGKLRATIFSFDSMMTKLGAIIGLLISGYLAKNYSIILAWQTSAVIFIIAIPLFLKLNYKDEK